MEHLRITVDGKAYDVIVEKIDDGSSNTSAPVVRAAAPAAAAKPAAPAPAPAPAPTSTPKGPSGAGDVTSPLAGLVQAIDVELGASVNVGDSVITLEAMKMYTPITAPAAGKIQAIYVKVGDAVEEGQVLYTIA